MRSVPVIGTIRVRFGGCGRPRDRRMSRATEKAQLDQDQATKERWSGIPRPAPPMKLAPGPKSGPHS